MCRAGGASGSVIMIAMVMLGVMFTASVLDATTQACFACPTSLRFSPSPPSPINIYRGYQQSRQEVDLIDLLLPKAAKA
jgi:hypothetical protein